MSSNPLRNFPLWGGIKWRSNKSVKEFSAEKATLNYSQNPDYTQDVHNNKVQQERKKRKCSNEKKINLYFLYFMFISCLNCAVKVLIKR